MVSGILRNYIYEYVFLKVKYALSFESAAAFKKYVRVHESKSTKDSEILEAEGVLGKVSRTKLTNKQKTP